MRALLSIGFAIALASCSAGTVSAAPRPFLRLPGAVPASMGYPPGDGTLFSFGSGADADPYAGLIDVNGVLYGTTCRNYSGPGTVFAVDAARTERVLHSFGNGTDGVCPASGVIDVNGILYGTTDQGGTHGDGTVFAVTTAGTERVLYNFRGSDGSLPSGLIEVNGIFYGTTCNGGKYGKGTVFAVTTAGTERVLHSFGNAADGAYPLVGLIDVNGILYGTTQFGGKYEAGTVFAVNAAGTERVLYNFFGSPYMSSKDGARPFADLIDVDGVLYGTTEYGGKYLNGIVFSVTAAGTERVLHSFGNEIDGKNPVAGLIDVNGVLYGTTSEGGIYGNGTIFAITTAGSERVMRSFRVLQRSCR